MVAEFVDKVNWHDLYERSCRARFLDHVPNS